jgi:4-amino-4-deoxy-L-arabinose transferase-like glycosyltransferase
VLLGCAALLFHRLLRVRLAPRAALGWTYAFGLYVPFLSVVTEVHKEPLAILLVVVAMTALTRALGGGSRLTPAAAGLALGALAMVRFEYGWVMIALLVLALLRWAVRRQDPAARRLVAIAAVAVVACVPWLAYTYGRTGHAMYWGTSSGESLFWMSPTVPGETGQWHSPQVIAKDPALATLRGPFRRVNRLDPVQRDLALRRQAVANVRARPAQYARNLVANVGRLFWAVPMRPRPSLLRTGADVLFNTLLLAALARAGVGLWRRRRDLPAEAAPIAVFAVLAIAAHLPASASPRMLLPVVPALLWLIAQSGSTGRRRRPRQL